MNLYNCHVYDRVYSYIKNCANFVAFSFVSFVFFSRYGLETKIICVLNFLSLSLSLMPFSVGLP